MDKNSDKSNILLYHQSYTWVCVSVYKEEWLQVKSVFTVNQLHQLTLFGWTKLQMNEWQLIMQVLSQVTKSTSQLD